MADPGAIPGINWTQVTPAERARLNGLIEHYRKKPHPFTACVRDNRKRFGEERAKRICAVLKDLIEGGTGWRGKDRKMDEVEPLDAEETRELIRLAEEIAGERDYAVAWDESKFSRQPKGATGGGRFKGKGAASGPRRTVKWAGKEMDRAQLLAQLRKTGVPVEAWAWKHKPMARRLGIRIPAKEPTLALRALNAKLGNLSSSKTVGGAVRSPSGRRFSEPAVGETPGMEREYGYNPNQRRAAKGTAIGGRWIKVAIEFEGSRPDLVRTIRADSPEQAAQRAAGQRTTILKNAGFGEDAKRHPKVKRVKAEGASVKVTGPMTGDVEVERRPGQARPSSEAFAKSRPLAAQPGSVPTPGQVAPDSSGSRRDVYRSVFDESGNPIGAFKTLPKNVTLSAATRQSGDANYEKRTLDEIPVGTVHYDVFGNLRIKLAPKQGDGYISVTNPSRVPMGELGNTAVYVPKRGRSGNR